MAIELPDDATAQAIASLRRYCAEELDHELGELPARLFLQFIVKEIGPSIYNAAIADAQAYLTERVADLEAACHEREFPHWPRGVPMRKPGR